MHSIPLPHEKGGYPHRQGGSPSMSHPPSCQTSPRADAPDIDTSPGMDPEVVGRRYRILDLLGRGGAGTVWRAQDGLSGPVALKRLHKTVADLAR